MALATLLGPASASTWPGLAEASRPATCPISHGAHPKKMSERRSQNHRHPPFHFSFAMIYIYDTNTEDETALRSPQENLNLTSLGYVADYWFSDINGFWLFAVSVGVVL